jgi:predicted NAD/FAD-binding protein
MQLKLLYIFLVSSLITGFSQNKVAVIGGGLAGVSAAHYIHKSDTTALITIFEKENQLGGNAQTIMVKNLRGQLVNIDVGPQYFAKSTWQQYLTFLNENNEFHEEYFTFFHPSIIIFDKTAQKPSFISPVGVHFRGESLKNILSFAKFYTLSRKVYKKKQNHPEHLGDWVEQLKLNNQFKKDFVYPFLAASLGTSIQQIKTTATAEIVKLYAFKNILSNEPFYVSNFGLGTIIKNIGSKLQKDGINIKTNEKVIAVEKHNDKLVLKTNNIVDEFDYIVFATHPYQAANILNTEDYPLLINNLKEFDYFKANIVIHRDSSLVNNKYKSFLNIETNQNKTELMSSTMNLVEINPLYVGLYKSWLSENDMQSVKEKNCFIHQEVFNHPLISPTFISNLIKLKIIMQNYENIYIAGGWTEGLETQETAVISGKAAAKKYILYKQNNAKTNH